MIWISSGIVDIHPRSEVFLGCGNGIKVNPINTLDRLEANIMIAWSHDREKKIVMISVDTLFMGYEVTNSIVTGLKDVFNSDEIFIASTHTHNAPMLDETKPKLGEKNHDYATYLVSQIVATTLRLSTTEPNLVSTKCRTVALSGIVSRRMPRLFAFSRKGIRLMPILQRPNIRKSQAKQALVADFVDDTGRIEATIAVIPCHPVAYMGLNVISADFLAPLRMAYRGKKSELEAQPFIAFQGASGDLNPWWKARWLRRGTLSFFDQLVNGVLFPNFKPSELQRWGFLRVKELVSNVIKNHSQFTDKHLSGKVDSNLIQLPLSGILSSAVNLEQRNVSIHAVDIEGFRIVGMSAELTWDLGGQLEDVLSGRSLVGCMRDVFGYATSSRQYLEGGYEAQGHVESFSISHLDETTPGVLLARILNDSSL